MCAGKAQELILNEGKKEDDLEQDLNNPEDDGQKDSDFGSGRKKSTTVHKSSTGTVPCTNKRGVNDSHM
jgi:hypothetical protein